MTTNLIPVTSRAKRGLQVLRELKSKPHRVFAAGPVFSEAAGEIDLFTTVGEQGQEEILEIQSQSLEKYEVNLAELSLSERTSNGSFISDTISDQGVYAAKIKI